MLVRGVGVAESFAMNGATAGGVVTSGTAASNKVVSTAALGKRTIVGLSPDKRQAAGSHERWFPASHAAILPAEARQEAADYVASRKIRG